MEDNVKIKEVKTEEKKNIKEKKEKKISKEVLNIFRTTMRNNIELTHIADNKANVLLSLNALMITFLIPFVIPYIDVILKFKLGFPLMMLIITCFVTIYISAQVLKPGKFNKNQQRMKTGSRVSPFFFGNFYKMNYAEFKEYTKGSLSDNAAVKDHLTEDLHYIGVRLGNKMSKMRLAFTIFLIGFFASISVAVLFLFIFP